MNDALKMAFDVIFNRGYLLLMVIIVAVVNALSDSVSEIYVTIIIIYTDLPFHSVLCNFIQHRSSSFEFRFCVVQDTREILVFKILSLR